MSLKIGNDFALPLDAASEANAILATRGAGKSYASAALIEELYRERIQVAVLDPTGVYWGLRASADGKKDGLAITILGGAHGDVPLEQNAGALIADVLVDTGQSLVLDLSDFPSKAAQTRFTSDFAERLYRRKAQNRTTLHLVIDEADEFIPQRVGPKEAVMVGAFEQIVKRGRSRGLGVTMITQRSQAINKSVLDLIETLIVMRMLSPRSVKVVADWITDKDLRDELDILGALPGLGTGQGYVWSPLRNTLTSVKFRRIRTFDSYATPKPGETRVLPEHLAEIDVTQLGEQIKATAERARENDPKALRARVAQLERELADRGSADRTAHVEYVEVEVPVEIEVPTYVPLLKPGNTLETVLLPTFRGLPEQLERAITEIEKLQQAVEAMSPRPDIPKRASKPVATPRAPRRREPVVSVGHEGPPRRVDTNGKLTGPEQRVLDAIRWYGVLGNETPNKTQVGFIAGYRVGKNVGGTYGNILGKLRSKGYLDYPAPSLVQLTDNGFKLSNDPDVVPDNRGVQEAVLARLTGPEQRVLSVLIDVYDKSMSKQELGERAGYTVGQNVGGTFGNILGRLRSLGVIDYPSPGEAVATDVLFPLGA